MKSFDHHIIFPELNQKQRFKSKALKIFDLKIFDLNVVKSAQSAGGVSLENKSTEF